MSWWRRLFGGKGSEPDDLSDDQLFQALVEAVGASDPVRLDALCRKYQERIVALTPTWRVTPEAIRSDPEAMQRVAQLHLHRGRALRELGRVEDAQTSFRAGLEVVEDDGHTRSELLAGLAMCMSGSEARQWWQRTVEVRDGSLLVQAFAETALAKVDGSNVPPS